MNFDYSTQTGYNVNFDEPTAIEVCLIGGSVLSLVCGSYEYMDGSLAVYDTDEMIVGLFNPSGWLYVRKA